MSEKEQINEETTPSLLEESKQARHSIPTKWYWVLGALAVVGALAFGLFSGNGEVSEVVILEETVTKGDIVLAVSTTGRVVPFQDVDLFFPSQGALSEVLVSEGQEVKAGDILAKQDTRDASLAIAQAEVSLQTAQANVQLQGQTGSVELSADAARADLEDARAELETMRVDQVTDSTNEYSQSLIKLSQAADVFNNALHEVDTTFAIDTRNGSYGGGAFSEYRTDTIANYRAAETAYDIFLTLLNAQKIALVESDMESAAVKAVDLGKLVNKALQAGLKTLEDTDVSDDLTLSMIDSFTTTLQSHQAKVKDEVLTVTQISELLASIEGDNEQDILDQEALIRSLEVKAATAGQGVLLADAQVSQALLNVTAARNRYEDLILRAPVSGTIGAVNYHAGEYIGSDKDTPAIVLNGADGVVVEAYIEEADVADIATGQVVLITFDAFDSEPIEGVVTFVSKTPTIDNNDIVSYRMVASADTKDERVRDGMTTYVDVVVSGVRDVLVAPVAAVRQRDGVPSVQLVDGSWVPVTTGFTDGKNVEVLSGLSRGDVVTYEE